MVAGREDQQRLARVDREQCGHHRGHGGPGVSARHLGLLLAGLRRAHWRHRRVRIDTHALHHVYATCTGAAHAMGYVEKCGENVGTLD